MNYQDHINLFKDEISDWMPEKYFDAHAHLGLNKFLDAFTSARSKMPQCTFRELPFEEYTRFMNQLFKGKELLGVFAFPFPLYECNIKNANNYIADVSKKNPSIKGFLLSNPHNTKETIDQYESIINNDVKIYGIKPYFDLLRKKNLETKINEFIPDDLLDFVNKEKLILMIHTAGKGVLEKDNIDFIKKVRKKYKNIKIILAHMGRYIKKEDFIQALKHDIYFDDNVYFDTSFATEKDVYIHTFENRRMWNKVMFAVDLPFGAITGIEAYIEGDWSVIKTRDRYKWSEKKHSGKKDLTYNAYHMIKALKETFFELKLNPDEEELLKEKIFYKNGLSLLNQMTS